MIFTMARTTLRQNIAAEAARLLLQKQAHDLYSARKKASRQFSRRRLPLEELPSNAEIEEQILSLTGIYSTERTTSLLLDLRLAAAEILRALAPLLPSSDPPFLCVTGDSLRDHVQSGAEISLLVAGEDPAPFVAALRDLGLRYLNWTITSDPETCLRARIQGLGRYPCTLSLYSTDAPFWSEFDPAERLHLPGLERLISLDTPRNILDTPDTPLSTEDHPYHPELRDHLRLYLQNLEAVRLDPRRHPEGDLLYHSLQVFQLARNHYPWDEEFLLASLLHDIGYALDRRHPQRALLHAVEPHLTPRTLFFLEHLPDAHDYLATGKIRASLRKSDDFEILILLARLDLEGRVCGGIAPTLDEALDYVFNLEDSWNTDS